MEEMVADSVSHRILWESITFPIWICRNTERDRKNVLVCVDGSEECLRVADHVGYMCGPCARNSTRASKCSKPSRASWAPASKSFSTT